MNCPAIACSRAGFPTVQILKVRTIRFEFIVTPHGSIGCLRSRVAKHRKSLPDVQHLTARGTSADVICAKQQRNSACGHSQANATFLCFRVRSAWINCNGLQHPAPRQSSTAQSATGHPLKHGPCNFWCSVYSMAGILDWAHAGGALVDASGKLHDSAARIRIKWAAMAPERCEVETFDATSFSFFRAILRVAWLVVAWPLSRLVSKGSGGSD